MTVPPREEQPAPHARLEVIPHDECIRLLEGGTVGRIGGIWDDEPQIVPVNYRWDGSGVLIRTDPGLTLRAVSDRTVVFEVDAFDAGSRTGWSVIVRGRGRESDRPATSVVPWAPGARAHWVHIEAETISGRRITQEDELTNQWWRMSASS